MPALQNDDATAVAPGAAATLDEIAFDNTYARELQGAFAGQGRGCLGSVHSSSPSC